MNLRKLTFKKSVKYFLPIIIIVIAVITYGFYSKEKKRIRQKTYTELSSFSAFKAQQLAHWQQERLSEVTFFTLSYPFPDYTKKILQGDLHALMQYRQSLLRIKNLGRFENIFLLDTMGQHVFSSDSTFFPEDNEVLGFTDQVVKTKKILVRDFYLCQNCNYINFDFYAPVFDHYGNVLAVLVFRNKPDDFLFPLIKDGLWPSSTVESYIVKEKGDSVIFLSELRFSPKSAILSAIPSDNGEITAVKAAKGLEGMIKGKNYKGVSVIADSRKVPGTEWFLITEIAKKEVFHTINSNVVLISFIISLIVASIFMFFNWLDYHKQFYLQQELKRKSMELKESNEEFRAALYSIGEGIITTDKDSNIRKINPAAEKLTGWPEVEAIGLPLDHIFRLYSEDDPHTQEDPMKVILERKTSEDFSNHILLINRNSEKIPLAFTGAPIKDDSENVSGIVIVFNDQTTIRAKQKVLEESERRFSLLFERAPLGYQSLDENNCLLEVNQAWLSTFGYSLDEVIGRNFDDFLAAECIQLCHELTPRLKKEGTVHTELYMTDKDGNKRVIAYNGRVGYKADGSFDKTHCIIQDISERKLAEEKLKTIEWMLDVKPSGGGNKLKNLTYGKLSDLNKDGLIKNSVDEETLLNIASDYLGLLETSTAIYEANGDYAMDIFSSGWCSLLDNASRTLCNTDDNKDALNCGHWLCHESCWTEASKKAIDNNSPFEIECNGGIRLYAVPIIANENVIGAINFGYGDPPDDPEEIRKISEKYGIKASQLQAVGKEYESRPPFIIELAKNRLQSSARLIGAFVEKKLAADAMKKSEEAFRMLIHNAPQGIFVQTNWKFAYINPVGLKLFGAGNENELLGKAVLDRLHPDFKNDITERILQLNLQKKDVPQMEEIYIRLDNTPFYVEVSAVPMNYHGENGVMVFFQDITARKNAENELISIKDQLERNVTEKTLELEERIIELERFREATINRELRMKELRDEIKSFKNIK